MAGPSDVAAWDRIRALLTATPADLTALTLAVVDLTEDERRAVAPELRSFVPARKYDPTHPVHEAAVALVGAGVLPDAKSVAAWLNRWWMRHVNVLRDAFGYPQYVETSVVPNVFYVLIERGVPWLAELAAQLAERLPRQADFGVERFQLVCRLIEHTEAPIPVSAGFVAGWVHRLRAGDLMAELDAHPEFGALLPHLFDVEEVGANLSHDPGWPVALASAVAQGRVERDAMVDSCVARLGRDGRPGATRAFLAVHDALAPTAAEVAARKGAYLAMIAAPASTVAGMAQARLSELDDHGELSAADRLALTEAILRRTEKKLVRAQLTRIAKRAAGVDNGPDLARLIASSWAGVEADLVRQGLRTIAALRLDDAARRAVHQAVPGALPEDLAAEVGVVLGTPQPASVRPGPAPTQLPTRVGLVASLGADDVVTELSSVLEGDAADLTAPQLERLIDGLLVASARDRDALRRALRPVLGGDRFGWLAEYHEYAYNRTLRHAVWALATAAVGDQPTIHPPDRHERWLGPEGVLTDRLFTLAGHRPLPPLSLSLPSWTNGLVDPDALIDRLGRAAAGGWEPPPREVEQALLRVDVPADVEARETLSLALLGLGTRAGRAAAGWIAAQLPDPPIIEATVRTYQHTDWEGAVTGETELVQVTVTGAAPAEWPNGIWDGLIRQRSPFTPPENFYSPMCWPAIAPRHREVIAAHCVRILAGSLDSSTRIAEALPPLAAVDGPVGEATALALSYGLCMARADQRAAAQRALVAACRRPEWDGVVFGRALANLVTRRSVVVKRAVEPLRQAVAAGAAPALWPALRELVATLLGSAAPTQPGLAEILALAAEAVQQSQAGGPIPALTQFAARPGKSRQFVEARRLAALLNR